MRGRPCGGFSGSTASGPSGTTRSHRYVFNQKEGLLTRSKKLVMIDKSCPEKLCIIHGLMCSYIQIRARCHRLDSIQPPKTKTMLRDFNLMFYVPCLCGVTGDLAAAARAHELAAAAGTIHTIYSYDPYDLFVRSIRTIATIHSKDLYDSFVRSL